MEAIKRAVEIAGSVRGLAVAADIAPATIYSWLAGKRQMSPRLALRVERATKGGVSRRQLLPDIFSNR